MLNLKIKKTHPEAIIPFKSRKGDAGLDLSSLKNYLIEPSEKILVETGISLEIPNGFVGLIWDRSGLAAKHSLHCLAGVIDSNYRGKIKVVLINLGKESYEIRKGNRIAQLLIQKIEEVKIEEVEDLEESSRGEKGFGSGGK